MHRPHHEVQEDPHPQPAGEPGGGAAGQPVPALARHHQEEDRGPHRKGVHQEGRLRQEDVRLPGLRKTE